jgi:hypothetical protein
MEHALRDSRLVPAVVGGRGAAQLDLSYPFAASRLPRAVPTSIGAAGQEERHTKARTRALAEIAAQANSRDAGDLRSVVNHIANTSNRGYYRPTQPPMRRSAGRRASAGPWDPQTQPSAQSDVRSEQAVPNVARPDRHCNGATTITGWSVAASTAATGETRAR